ncbi:hypothetical protein [Moraxella bovis]|uniref:Uncharacterized protein n=1 Tax=Moraxella bovis TaxID=476 RepID=A0AAQ2Q7F4_MORBO|nr:hypothetical protein [Moraxella bovis]AWY20230.1 hypothetical protein DQF64_06830 [Moraxella bovis]OOR92178.1 hypothetical protein B0182_01695 [Moraxella bovis]UYZ74626.1 hypothetical protein LP093_07495 [Moraxella bovis]UYZ79449.1 hypothetical protein LP115_06410 [Moraxella bovis]UYZ79952.1 hypothetical protein LP113_07750 [Moraxella bovis]
MKFKKPDKLNQGNNPIILILFFILWLIGAIIFGTICTFIGGYVRPHDDTGIWLGLVLSAIIYVVATMIWLLGYVHPTNLILPRICRGVLSTPFDDITVQSVLSTPPHPRLLSIFIDKTA